MKKFVTSAALLAALSIGGAASAATFKYTEGNRADIDGSVRVLPNGDGSNDTAGTPPGFVLDTITRGDKINLHGRIVNIQDRYTFTSTTSFSLQWIFGGYMVGGSLVDEDRSGFSGVPTPGNGDNTSEFRLTNKGLDGMIGGGDDVLAGLETYTTDINRTTGDPQKIFAGRFDAGTYELFIDGFGEKDALYDIQISAVPLPAGAVLLLTGLAGLGAARRRKARAA